LIDLILAVANNGVIGNEGKMPWNMKSDLKRFRDITMNKKIIMGRKTYESLPKKLPGREYIVVSSSKKIDDVTTGHNLFDILKLYASSREEVFVIGGANVARQSLPFCNHLYITRIKKDYDGDAVFDVDLGERFDLEYGYGELDEQSGLEYYFEIWRRKLRLVIFDMDGLMIDSEKKSRRAWLEAAREAGFDMSDEFFYGLVGANLSRAKQRMAEYYPDIDLEKFYAARQRISDAIYATEPLEAKPGLYELVDFLNDYGILKAVASSTRRERVVSNMKAIGMSGKLNYIVCGDEVKKSKPSGDIYRNVLSHFSCEPRNAIVLEDSKLGILSAQDAGARCLLIPDIVPADEQSKAIAYAVAPDLHGARDIIAREIGVELIG
jgi:HAD superfamily hydrolase (TIGR01509 family)